jgi:hypothetical protein
VSFDVPFPPDFGGAVDVFYKLKALSEAGVKIYLHVFEADRGRQAALEKYCEQVFYYPRNKSFLSAIRLTPFIVISRKNGKLIENLNQSKAPVLFEGIHTTFPLKSSKFKPERTYVRMHNVEHEYYHGLSRNEHGLLKSLFFWTESLKLKHYQKVLKKCDHILSISPSDQTYFEKIPGFKSTFVPAFLPYGTVRHLEKKGYFALFHGDLAISDNRRSAHFLTDVFSKLDLPFIIAGRTDDKRLLSKIEAAKNIQFIRLENQEQLDDLIQRAHINVLWSRNSSGIKVKLLNSLFNGRFCLVNTPMVEGSGLEDLCVVADDEKALIYNLIQLMDREYPEELFRQKKEKLQRYEKQQNTSKLIELLYP